MNSKHPPWILVHLLMVISAVAGTDLENVDWKIIFYQTEGDATYVRDTGDLASDVPTEIMFELFDPQRTLSAAKFTYTLDLGNGEVIQGTEPVVRFRYLETGNYTLRLEVEVNLEQYAPITRVYSKDVQVLDAIKSIELEGPSDYRVSQGSSLAVHVDGSPPMWVCLRVLNNCLPDPTAGCTLTMLYDNTLGLNHTFTSTGVHCLDVSVRNDISQMETSFSLYVGRKDSTQVLFILSCAAVLVATFAFITVVACRPWKQRKSQAPASSNAAFLKDQGREGQSKIILSFSSVEKGEQEPLILQHGTQYGS